MRSPIRSPDRAAAALVLALAIGMPATAQQAGDESVFMRPDDHQRLAALDQTAGAALRGAFAAGAPGDLEVLADALTGAPLSAAEARGLLAGDWSCRMIKLGGGLPIVIYQPFRCRADAEGGFEKLSGSQRTRGRIHPADDRLIYLGTGFVAGETPVDYEDLPETVDPAAQPQLMPEAGLVEITAPDRGRIIFPRPYLESDLNLLVLRR